MNSDWELIEIKNNIIFIRDLDLGNKSLTNDAERVARIFQHSHPNHRLVYQDSEGDWCEIILHNDQARFIPYDG